MHVMLHVSQSIQSAFFVVLLHNFFFCVSGVLLVSASAMQYLLLARISDPLKVCKASNSLSIHCCMIG